MSRAAVLFFALAGGCAGLEIHSEVAPETELSGYRSYGWLRADNQPAHAPETIIDQKVRAALKRELAQKGLVEGPADSADFLIGYHVLQEHVTSVSDWGNGIYGWAPEVSTYNQGTLIVDFVDPRTNRVFWRSSANRAVEPPGGLIDTARLQRAAAAMVRSYPGTLTSASATNPKL